MGDKQFSLLYEIASRVNKEFNLHAALRIALEKTVELLNLETGWIWLVQPDVKSVYLAASFNLPPALSDHPERLSGWCYCIAKYLSDGIDEARNISEIACSRLKDIKSENGDLKFHATIPITVDGQKVGLINLLHKESQELSENQLSILNTVSELVGMAVKRTRSQESFGLSRSGGADEANRALERFLNSRIRSLSENLDRAKKFAKEADVENTVRTIEESLRQIDELKRQYSLLIEESGAGKAEGAAELQYPGSPLTSRELEALTLVKRGYTNKQIAERLYISERTVKFHLSSILSKLNARTRTEAVDTAIKRGLLGL